MSALELGFATWNVYVPGGSVTPPGSATARLNVKYVRRSPGIPAAACEAPMPKTTRRPKATDANVRDTDDIANLLIGCAPRWTDCGRGFRRAKPRQSVRP